MPQGRQFHNRPLELRGRSSALSERVTDVAVSTLVAKRRMLDQQLADILCAREFLRHWATNDFVIAVSLWARTRNIAAASYRRERIEQLFYQTPTAERLM